MYVLKSINPIPGVRGGGCSATPPPIGAKLICQ